MLMDPFEPEDKRRPGAWTEASGYPGTGPSTTQGFGDFLCPSGTLRRRSMADSVPPNGKQREGLDRSVSPSWRTGGWCPGEEPWPSVPAGVGHRGGAGSEADDIERSSVFVSVFLDVRSWF